ncbi:DNA cytosine methyltransferase [Streptomyces californicus]|uniref:DNA cytosine methyltransferase n=1 Tax=Streptomyces californicus TaxID=67351 RepID=UPI0004C26A7C|nr:DNA cytosine methyltransferase [Streptomyces californicus]QRV53480.1 DNA cytosine methyltransferase [Streptomyces californicus]
MKKPRLLDLFCCSGGAGEGYFRAGFDVVGVDIVERERYPHLFVKADALEILRNVDYVRTFDAVHASPPCQAACALTKGTNQHLAPNYDDLYDETKELMEAAGVPGVIENPSARPDVVLCGEMFGLGVLRHRNIELVGWTTDFKFKRDHRKHRGRVRGLRHGVWYDGPYVAAYGNGGGKATVPEMQRAMGITWTDVREELTEAIPPAYTEWIGERLMAHVMGDEMREAA